MKHLSLLDDPVFRVAPDDCTGSALTLPQTLARLSAGDDLLFVALRPHQRPAWHAFLVQLAYLALEAAADAAGDGIADAVAPTDARTWAAHLRALTPSHPGDEPWHLIVDDWTRPAFLQSPCAAGAEGDYRNPASSAQELDLLVTAKNHDEKIGKLRPAVPDEADVWVYALATLQGFTPGLGPGNHNSMRMNGYFASRPQFRLVTQAGAGAEFLRDLHALQQGGESLLRAADRAGMGCDDPLALLWLEPWSAKALPLQRVHPLCLEVSRRVRLRTRDGGVEALSASSASMRVGAKEAKGQVHDPWTPVVLDGEPRALTAQADSLSYHRLAPLLFDDSRCRLPLLAKPTAAELDSGAAATLAAQVLVGGSGRTDGMLRREVPMPSATLRQFGNRRKELANRAASFIDLAGLAQGKVLRAALLQFVDGSKKVSWQNKDFAKAVAPWVAMFERRIDEAFFGVLFETMAADPPLPDADARGLWIAALERMAREVFALAVTALPTRDGSVHIARARAQRMFDNGLREHLQAEPAQAAPRQGNSLRTGAHPMNEPSAEPKAPPSPRESLDFIARRLAHERVDRGLLAALRRFHPASHGRHNVFEVTQVLHAAGVQDTDAERFPRWSLVVHCLALVRGAHNQRDAGEALYTLGLKEARLRQLLEADAAQLMDLLPLLARRVAAAGMAMNWWPLAKLALYADIHARNDYEAGAADEARAWLARGFVTAEGRDVQAQA